MGRKTADEGPDLMTIPEAARLLGVADKTAIRLAQDGEFPGEAAFKIGRQWRVSRPRLLRFLHDQETEAADAGGITEDQAAELARLRRAVADIRKVLDRLDIDDGTS